MTSRGRRPVPANAGHHLASSGGVSGGGISIENEIERSRELERWKKAIEKQNNFDKDQKSIRQL